MQDGGVNWTHNTVTAEEIIRGLIANGVILSAKDKQLIIDKVYTAVTRAAAWTSNGCDCGQMSCPICS